MAAADLSGVYQALRNADAAGDTAAAQRLASYIQSQSAAASATQPSYMDRVSQAGDAMDAAAMAGGHGQLSPVTLGRTAVGAGEDALSMGSGVLGDIAGALTSAVTQNPQRGAAVRSALTYEPRTATGKAGQAYVGALASPLTGLLNAPVQALQNAGHPILAQGVRAAEDVAPAFLPKAIGGAARAVAPEVQEATDAGLRLTPEKAGGGPVAKAVQGLTGSAKLERNLSLKNAPQVNKLAAQEIGAPDLTDASLEKARQPAFDVYNQAKKAGTVQLHPADFNGVQAPGTLKDPAVQALQDHYANMGAIDAKDLIADMRKLRADAPKNIKAPNAPSQNDLGWAQKAAADALEGALDRHLQGLGNASPVNISDFRNARVQLAKIHSVEDAMDGPNISAKLLNKQLERGVPLSGNLRTIANAYGNFDRSLQDVSRIRDSGPLSALDTSLMALAGRAHPAVLAATVAKPLARAALASKAYQGVLAGRPLLPAIPTGLLRPLPALLNQEQPQGLLR